MSDTIETDDVIRLILQFLRENNLDRTLGALHTESSVTFNTVDNKESFLQDIEQGRWDVVLRQVQNMKIPPKYLYDLYEQMITELVELNEQSTAKVLLRRSEPMASLRENQVDRYAKLEELVARPKFDAKLAYPDGATKEGRRKAAAKGLGDQITVVPPSRLLALLGQCLKWQQHQGILAPDNAYDLFRGVVPEQKAEDDSVANQLYSTIKFPGKKAYAETAVFAPNGQYLATGTIDGFIEIWNYATGKLRKDLKYQAEDRLMAMDNSVICLNFSRDSQLLVSGSNDGKIAVWKVQTGTCQRRLSPAHSQGVTSVCFNKDGSQVLSGSYDQTVKIHGLRSGKTLKEFRGHSSFVNSVLFSSDNSRVLSASSDGTVKVWDAKTTSCLHTITPQINADISKVPSSSSSSSTAPTVAAAGALANHTVQVIVPLPKNIDQVLVCTKSNTLYMMTMRGQIVKTYSHQKETGSDFVSATVSPQCELVYGIGEDSVLYCFQAATGKLINETKICNYEAVGLVSHPRANVIVSHDDHGHVYFLKA
ncbi:WD40-repeat-containing domain protein [Zychaea mexicana]|uniref:WD40-repeat-containing domain protein n=1 Tax=Zychaea mexicana TaxID=64656 RepID=UPI0022FF2286|nr:WD40-repeat-containing domain protein [Zychaea mexicana]KAI9484857.1 WD40-repeat-containing domain protein [Zychaea mexicana]